MSLNNIGNIKEIDIRKEMMNSYIDYAMSVIVSRALPDVRDGLKPVHRRILYSMHELNLTPEKSYRKCARIVGDVLGKYHPHGDTAVYDALVRMAQDFSIRYTLVNGHGNFGSVDGDSAAAMRYTEAKMEKITAEMLRDINKNTVDFVDNFDGEEKEPTVLPARYPNLLVNGSSGIAVGMATNIPPHNLREVIDGVIMLIDEPDCQIADLMKVIKGPDFPTAGIILGKAGIKSAYETGRGKILVKAKSEIIEEKGRNKIIVTELPYQVNKAKLIESIADLVKDKKIDGISDLRDESSREGMRIVIELKRDSNPNVVLNRLYKHTRMRDTFGVIMIALVNNEPKQLNLKQVLVHYLDHQREVFKRKTQFDLDKALARAHILEGLRIALDHIDEVIKLIRGSKTGTEAKEGLMEKFKLSDKQAQAILDMRLQRLTGLERDKIEAEYDELQEKIAELRAILADDKILLDNIRNDLLEIRTKFGDERRSHIDLTYIDSSIDMSDLIEEEQIVVTLTHNGYIKRLPIDTYTSQRRGGRGIQGVTTRDEDFIEHMFITSTHNNIVLFTNKGRAYKLKGYEIPEASRTAKGINLVNLISLEADEKVQTAIAVKEFGDNEFLVMGTKNGIVKKTAMSAYSAIRRNGLNAITLREGDELVNARVTEGNNEIIFVTKNGYSIKFNENDVRPMGRTASGVKAITLRDNDQVVSMVIAKDCEELLVVSENGLGKRTRVEDYPQRHRGGKGVITYKVTEKTGLLVGARIVCEDDEIMLINSNGIVIRLNVRDISVTGRNTMGVKLMRSGEEDTVVAIAKINCIDDENEEIIDNENDEQIEVGTEIIESTSPEDEETSEDEESSEE